MSTVMSTVEETTRAPAVSVLITAFNREQYIAESIESVLAQTFTDLELVIVDDASTDRTVEIARAYERQDARIRVVVNERNLGDYGNRNRAAELARGSLLKYHDSDDVMYPHCLGVMVPMLLSAPSAGFALSGPGAWPGGSCPMLLTPKLAYEREFLGFGLFNLGPAAAMFRAGVLRELGGFPEAGVPSDYLFWIAACARVNVLLVSGDLFHYRIHSDQELASPRSDVAYARASAAAWAMLNSPDCLLDAQDIDRAKRNWAYTVARGAYRQLKIGHWQSAAAIIRYSGIDLLAWARYLRPPRRTAAAGTPQADGVVHA